MVEAAGVKRRKAKSGNYNVLKNRKTEIKKKRSLHKAGLEFLGLQDDIGKQCLLTRIDQAGLVSNLKKFKKPTRDEAMVGPGVKRLEKLNQTPKYRVKPKQDSEVMQTVLNKRREAKDKAFSRRNIAVPKPQALRMIYFLDKYGEDYKAMTTDPMNYDQFTWKQLRSQVNSFKSTTSQFAEYLADRGLLKDLADETKVKGAKNKVQRKKQQISQQSEENSEDESDESMDESMDEEESDDDEQDSDDKDDVIKSKSRKQSADEDDDDLSSDGENGMNFMAKVRAMERTSKSEGSKEEEQESSDDEAATLPTVTTEKAQLSEVEKKNQSKRRLRAKNYKLAKRKSLKKSSRKGGLR